MQILIRSTGGLEGIFGPVVFDPVIYGPIIFDPVSPVLLSSPVASSPMPFLRSSLPIVLLPSISSLFLFVVAAVDNLYLEKNPLLLSRDPRARNYP